MTPQLKRELNDQHIGLMCSASLKAKLKGFAEENGVTESAAARYILSLYFEVTPDNFGKSKETRPNSKVLLEETETAEELA